MSVYLGFPLQIKLRWQKKKKKLLLSKYIGYDPEHHTVTNDVSGTTVIYCLAKKFASWALRSAYNSFMKLGPGNFGARSEDPTPHTVIAVLDILDC